MSSHHRSRALGLTLACSALFGLQACSSIEADAPVMTTAEVQAQQLGESTQTVWFSGQGAGLVPDYSERVLAHFYNRIRMYPQNWPIVNDMGQTLLLDAYPPSVFQPYMTEAGRWQAQHGIETGCDCSAEVVGYDPMDPATMENEKYVNATCCEMGVLDGVAQCVSPLVTCKDERATLKEQRWALLNQGAGKITGEDAQNINGDLPTGLTLAAAMFDPPDANAAAIQLAFIGTSANTRINAAMGISLSEGRIPPAECQDTGEEENPCGDDGSICRASGTDAEACDTAANPDCLGLCVGGAKDGSPCKLPEDNTQCDPENWPKIGQFVFLSGETIEPSQVLSDGIHYQNIVAEDATSAFDTQNVGNMSYAVHFFEATGEPVGTPSEIKVIVDGSCSDLTAMPVEPLRADDSAANYAGMTFKVDAAVPTSCTPYVFLAKDAAGIEYTFPEYGSLQVNAAGGEVLVNDETCPVWTEQRVSLGCATPANECDAGETRPCYTGRAGTQANGACSPGSESCTDGRWTGSCENQVTPESADACGDKVDNNCNGSVDEGCEDTDDGGTKDSDMGDDMGGGGGGGGNNGGDGDGGEEDDGGCTQTPGKTPSGLPLFPLAFAGLLWGAGRVRRIKR